MSNRPKVADPTDCKWPYIDSIKEETVLKTLANVFSKYKMCLRTIKNPPKWKKVEAEKLDKLSEEEEMQKKMFKSWFVVGLQTVMKQLERNGLAAVILWRDVQPAVIRKALMQLISRYGCPAVCVTDLVSSMQQSWPSLHTASALGIRKMEEPNDFEELADIIRKYAPKVADPQFNVKQPYKITEASDNANEQTQHQTVLQQSGLQNETSSENVCRPEVDARRFYIYKSEKGTSKSFSGQSFIAFDEGPQCSVSETVKGERIQKGTRQSERHIFGIRPSLGHTCTSDISSDITVFTSETKGVARSFNGGKRNNKIENKSCNKRRKETGNESENPAENMYRKIRMKKMQNNTQKPKKIKKKKANAKK